MPKVTYDTNIFIKHKPKSFPKSFYMSIVVLQELLAGAPDKSTIQALTAAKHKYQKSDRLLTPTAEDWWEVGRVINALQKKRKSKTGLIPKMTAQEKYRITHDVLIARTAKSANVMIVTDNEDDFKKISRFCGVKLIGGSEFLKKLP